MKWVDETYKLIQEDKKEQYSIMMMLHPLGRTPMDEKSGRAMRDYSKSIEKMLDSLTPWESSTGHNLKSLRKKVKSGTVSVILDPGEKNNPLYEGANIIRGK